MFSARKDGRTDPVKRLLLPGLILLTAFGLRMFRLGAQPLWSDEVYSVAVAQHSMSEVAAWVYRDNHPALYWFVLYPIVHLLGDAELLVRFPSAVMGTVTVALTYAAGRQVLGNHRVGNFAALWLAVSPIQVVYSQEARMYAPLALFGIASTLFLYRGASRGGVLNWVLFGVTAAATAHSHNYGLLLVAAQGLWGLSLLLWKRKGQLLWGSAVSLATFALLYAPMIPALLAQMEMSVGSTGVATRRDVVDFLESFGAGFTGFSTPGLTPGPLVRGTALPSVAITMTLALLGVLKGGKKGAGSSSLSERGERWNSLLLGVCIAFPVAFVYSCSVWAHKALWQVRGFQVALACFALLVGAGLERLRPPLLRWGTCFSLVVFAGVNLYPHYFDRYKSTVPDAAAALEERLGSEDILFVAPYWDWTPFRYYYRDPIDAIGGRKEGDTLHVASVGADYADLIDPRSLELQSEVRQPIISPDQFEPDDYSRVWAISHWATPQRVLELFGNDVTVMHYDVNKRDWQAVVYPVDMSLSSLSFSVESSSLRWSNGLRLLGYQWREPPVVGQKAGLTLFWTTERPQTRHSHLRLRLTDGEGGVAFEDESSMLSLMHSLPMTALGIRSEFPTTAWPASGTVAQHVELEIPPELPPLSYRLSLQVVDTASLEPVPIAGGNWGLSDHVSVARPSEPLRPREVPVQHREDVSFGGEVSLLGYDLPDDSARPGHQLSVWLHWVAETPPSADYQVQLRLLDNDGVPLTEVAGSLSSIPFPTSMWDDGDLAQGTLGLPLPPRMEGGQYRLAVRVVNADAGEPLLTNQTWGLGSREWVVVGRAEILSWPMVTEPPVIEHETNAQFGGGIRLLGYDLTGSSAPGGRLNLTLYWKATTTLDRSYSVLVHFSDRAENLVAQADGIPVDWLRPTTTWREGEIIIDQRTLALPTELSAGRYRLYVGLYEPEGQRLPVVSQGQRVPDGRLLLTYLRVEAN